MRKVTVTGNYLDFIPVYRESCRYRMGDSGDVTILQENRGLFHWIAQKVFHRPRISQIHLDEMGNFIWPLMDGERTVYDIAMLVREEFGVCEEPGELWICGTYRSSRGKRTGEKNIRLAE